MHHDDSMLQSCMDSAPHVMCVNAVQNGTKTTQTLYEAVRLYFEPQHVQSILLFQATLVSGSFWQHAKTA